jgi:hypothetical protein
MPEPLFSLVIIETTSGAGTWLKGLSSNPSTTKTKKKILTTLKGLNELIHIVNIER